MTALPQPAALVDEILLVHGWLEAHRADVHVLKLGAAGRPFAEGAEDLVERVRLCAERGAEADAPTAPAVADEPSPAG